MVFRERLMWAAGQLLVESEQPRKADAALVLGGDWSGRRVLKGAELVREGYAAKLVISNGPVFYRRPESEVAADFAAEHGYDRSTMVCIRRTHNRTQEEAAEIPGILRSLGIHTVLLVTSPSHTARAARIFRRMAPDLEFHPVPAADPNWCGGRWWQTRECQKTWFFETVKSTTEPFGI